MKSKISDQSLQTPSCLTMKAFSMLGNDWALKIWRSPCLTKPPPTRKRPSLCTCFYMTKDDLVGTSQASQTFFLGLPQVSMPYNITKTSVTHFSSPGTHSYSASTPCFGKLPSWKEPKKGGGEPGLWSQGSNPAWDLKLFGASMFSHVSKRLAFKKL